MLVSVLSILTTPTSIKFVGVFYLLALSDTFGSPENALSLTCVLELIPVLL